MSDFCSSVRSSFAGAVFRFAPPDMSEKSLIKMIMVVIWEDHPDMSESVRTNNDGCVTTLHSHIMQTSGPLWLISFPTAETKAVIDKTNEQTKQSVSVGPISIFEGCGKWDAQTFVQM